MILDLGPTLTLPASTAVGATNAEESTDGSELRCLISIVLLKSISPYACFRPVIDYGVDYNGWTLFPLTSDLYMNAGCQDICDATQHA